MKKAVGLFAIVLALGLGASLDAEAKRLGGARSSGMQRQQTTQPNTPNTAPNAAPNSAGATAPAAGAAAAAAPAAGAGKRSWMGPVAGIAAGLGLMALASHFGFGEAMANMMLFALLGIAVMAVVAYVMRKRAGAGPAPAWAGAGAAQRTGPTGVASSGTRIGSAIGGLGVARSQAGAVPAGFDAVAFADHAKSQFMALQAANDARDLDRLREVLTPEMLAVVGDELQARGDTPQRTEVFGLDARVTDVAEEGDRYVVSVRFTGSTRDQHDSVPEDLDEIWHLTKPRAGAGGWVVAGIQQAQ